MTSQSRCMAGIGHDPLSSSSNGPFPIERALDIPSYFEDNLIALRHWNPPRT